MVRLKVYKGNQAISSDGRFNSNMVRLKEIFVVVIGLKNYRFNSNMVRLKGKIVLLAINTLWGFNSNMVRLKDAKE